MADSVEIESKYAPPLAECAHCDHMLPQGLGEKECKVCGAVCRVSHQPTIDSLTDEALPCPHCNTVIVAGTDERERLQLPEPIAAAQTRESPL